MHPNPAFRQTAAARSLAFVRERGFGTLMVNGPEGPLAAHVPFVLDKEGKVADLHLVRSNPVFRLIGTEVSAVLAVTGPDGYISPDWYGIEDQVPTWNYVAVHLRGNLSARPDDTLRGHLDEVSAAFESRLLPKQPWLADKMPDDLLARMMRTIVPCRLTVAEVQSTWKLGQNKPEAARLAAAKALVGHGPGQETEALAGLMRNVES
jgi:transcriptional regulator